MKTELVLWKFHIPKVLHADVHFLDVFASFRSSLQSVLRGLKEVAFLLFCTVTRRLDHEIFGMLNKAIEETAITYLPSEYFGKTPLIVSFHTASRKHS